MEDGSGNSIYLDKLEINKIVVIDSLKIRKNGSFKFKIKPEHPDFYMIRNIEGKFLTILPFPGERIEIKANYENPGSDYSIKGSEESEKVRVLSEQLNTTKSKLKNLDSGFEEAAVIDDSQALEYLNRRKEIVKEQRDFSIRFIIENLKSVASVYAIYQNLDQDHLVLGENRDIQYMKILADSVTDEYSHIPFVKSFIEDARATERKYYNILGLSGKIKEAGTGIPDIVLPDINGDTIKLSSYKGKTVLLYFWASFSPPSREQNPSLHTLYQRYKNKGFEVFAVSLDNNKEAWEKAVRFDELKWKNVSELKFPNSEVAANYNITSLPVNFLINREGEIIGRDLYGKELEKWLSNILN